MEGEATGNSLAKTVGGDILNRGVTVREFNGPIDRGVNPGNPATGFGEGDREREPDIAEADHCDLRRGGVTHVHTSGRSAVPVNFGLVATEYLSPRDQNHPQLERHHRVQETRPLPRPPG